jgi:hypothetical protein
MRDGLLALTRLPPFCLPSASIAGKELAQSPARVRSCAILSWRTMSIGCRRPQARPR